MQRQAVSRLKRAKFVAIRPTDTFAAVPALALLLTLLLLNGCARSLTPAHQPPPALLVLEQQQQRSLALARRLERQTRILRLSFPLLVAAEDLCPDNRKAALGLRFSNSNGIEEKYRHTAIRDLGLGEALQVIQVVPDSPAAQAGVRVGDTLVALNQQPFQVGAKAAASLPALLASLQAGEPAPLTLARNGQTLTVEITPVSSCDYPILIAADDRVNAVSDGRRIILNQGLLRFASDDRDLALVIAHELAHNVINHVPKIIANALQGTLLDLLALGYGIPSPGAFTLAAAQFRRQSFETEADYLALYLLARTGQPLSGSADFWRRVASEYPDQIDTDISGSHPSSPARFLAMEATINEIKRKQALGLPLEPEWQAADRR